MLIFSTTYRGIFYKSQRARQGVKLTRFMSIFTSKKVWKFLIQIQLTKSNPKITRGVKVPWLMPIRVKVLWTDWTINKEVGNKLMDVTLFHCYSAMIDRIWDHPIIGIRHWTVDLRLASSLVYHIVTVSLSPIAIFNYIDALLVCDTQTIGSCRLNYINHLIRSNRNFYGVSFRLLTGLKVA